MTPNTIDPALVAEVAMWLTPGQRRALESVQPEQAYEYSFVHGIPRVALFNKGVFGPTDYLDSHRFCLTPFGTAVRRFLQEQQA